jgi:hypothetical protein
MNTVKVGGSASANQRHLPEEHPRDLPGNRTHRHLRLSAKSERQRKYPNLKIYERCRTSRRPRIQLVLNLTRPYEHYAVTKAALLAGKHVYSEKPLAATFEEGKELAELAIPRPDAGRSAGYLLGRGHPTAGAE